LNYNNLLNWLGLTLFIFSACCIATVGFKNSAWFGNHKNLTSSLKKSDLRLVKIAAIAFSIGVLFFIIGGIL